MISFNKITEVYLYTLTSCMFRATVQLINIMSQTKLVSTLTKLSKCGFNSLLNDRTNTEENQIKPVSTKQSYI